MKKVGNHTSFSRILFLCLTFVLTFSTGSFAQDVAKGKELFNANCAACHKLDANSTGPALRGVVDRHPTEWLHNWIKNSSGLIKSGDAAAVKLFNEWNKVRSEEHTSELQSRENLVCRLLLEKKNHIRNTAGVLKPRSGSIGFERRDIAGLDSHRVCNLARGLVAEGREVFPTLTVLENVQVGA